MPNPKEIAKEAYDVSLKLFGKDHYETALS